VEREERATRAPGADRARELRELPAGRRPAELPGRSPELGFGSRFSGARTSSHLGMCQKGERKLAKNWARFKGLYEENQGTGQEPGTGARAGNSSNSRFGPNRGETEPTKSTRRAVTGALRGVRPKGPKHPARTPQHAETDQEPREPPKDSQEAQNTSLRACKARNGPQQQDPERAEKGQKQAQTAETAPEPVKRPRSGNRTRNEPKQGQKGQKRPFRGCFWAYRPRTAAEQGRTHYSHRQNATGPETTQHTPRGQKQAQKGPKTARKGPKQARTTRSELHRPRSLETSKKHQEPPKVPRNRPKRARKRAFLAHSGPETARRGGAPGGARERPEARRADTRKNARGNQQNPRTRPRNGYAFWELRRELPGSTIDVEIDLKRVENDPETELREEPRNSRNEPGNDPEIGTETR